MEGTTVPFAILLSGRLVTSPVNAGDSIIFMTMINISRINSATVSLLMTDCDDYGSWKQRCINYALRKLNLFWVTLL